MVQTGRIMRNSGWSTTQIRDFKSESSVKHLESFAQQLRSKKKEEIIMRKRMEALYNMTLEVGSLNVRGV